MTKNANLLFAQVFVDELAKGGVREVCIAPGSRSTPLTLAFSRQSQIRVTMHLDERSAAFFALGLAQASSRPVAVVCTSGSAAANFFPAIVEARMAQTPLLILTADRSHELRGSGANQTIDQVKLYGEQVLWAVDMPLPVTDQPDLVLRHVRTLAARALAMADGLSKGPVHLNFPFRKPLEPEDEAGFPDVEMGGVPFTHIERGVLLPDERQIDFLAELLSRYERGLIVCGPRCPAGNFPGEVSALAQRCGYPLLADPLSGLRFCEAAQDVVSGYDSFLAFNELDLDAPQLVIHFGAVAISAVLAAYLERANPAQRVHIAEDGVWADDAHRTNWFLQANEAEVCRRLNERLQQRNERMYVRLWSELENQTREALTTGLAGTEFFDGAAVAQVIQALPQRANLFVGNSLAVRHLDQFGLPRSGQIRVFGNRGASGIDGNVSTASGIAAAQPSIPLAAILGDITFYHDSNGLLAVKKYGLSNVTFVVVNNNGGGIFHRLPVARFDPPFTDAFLTPHELDFSALAQMYGLEYFSVEGRIALAEALEKAFKPGAAAASRLVEVFTDSNLDLQRRSALLEKIQEILQHDGLGSC